MGQEKPHFFNMIAGYLNPDPGGEIIFKQKRTDNMKPYEMCNLGVARTFQSSKAFWTFNGT